MDHIWIVEMKEKGKWYPVEGMGITRANGREDVNFWKRINPDDKFRLRKYVPMDTVGR